MLTPSLIAVPGLLKGLSKTQYQVTVTVPHTNQLAGNFDAIEGVLLFGQRLKFMSFSLTLTTYIYIALEVIISLAREVHWRLVEVNLGPKAPPWVGKQAGRKDIFRFPFEPGEVYWGIIPHAHCPLIEILAFLRAFQAINNITPIR
jgi:hypothetical protein